MKKINVLGTAYTLAHTAYTKDPLLINNAGYCDRSSKRIVIASSYTPSASACANSDVMRAETIRHELVHAFFIESGHERWSCDEDLVEWIAIQFPKMLTAMDAAGGIEHE